MDDNLLGKAVHHGAETGDWPMRASGELNQHAGLTHREQLIRDEQAGGAARGQQSPLVVILCFVGVSSLLAWLVFLGSNLVHFALKGEAFETFEVFGISISRSFALACSLLLGAFAGSLLHYARVRRFEMRTMLADSLLFGAGLIGFAAKAVFDLKAEDALPAIVDMVVLCLCGVGLPQLLSAYFQKLYECVNEDVEKFLVMSSAAGMVIGCLFSFGDWQLRKGLGCALCAMTLAIFLALVCQERKCPFLERPTASDSDKRDRIDRNATIPVLITGFAVGFAYWLMLGNVSVEYVSIACVAAAALPSLIWLFCIALGHLVKEPLVAKMILPVYVILFLLYLVNESDVSFMASFGIIAFSVFSILLSLCAICEHSLRDNLLVSRFADRLMMQLSASALVGLALAGFICVLPSPAFLFGMIAVVSLLAVILSVVTRKNTWPGEESLLCYDSATCPMRSIKPSRVVSLGDQPHFGGRFLQRCEAISKRYGLTERQGEILVFLAKGRNAEHISKELTISPYTVKTHIYNVFQKIGVHSQQELIDTVEDWPLDD